MIKGAQPTEEAMKPQQRNPERIQAAMLEVGHAVWHLQLVEDVLCAHHVLLHELEPGCAAAELQAAIERRQAQTLGQLVKLPRLADSLDPAAIARLKALLGERNWLVHESRRDTHVALYADEGARGVFEHFARIHDEALAVMKLVQEATERGLARKGVSQERIARDADAILRSWESGNRHPGEVGRT